MKLKNVVVAAALAVTPALFADEAPAKAEEAKQAVAAKVEAAKPEIKIDEAAIDKLLAAIPEVAATYGENGKVTGKEIKDFIRPQMLNAAKQGATFDQAQILSFAAQFAQQQLVQNMLVDEAKKQGFQPDTEAAVKQLNEAKQANGEDNVKKMLEQMGTTEEAIISKFAESAMIDAMFNSFIKLDENAAKKFYDENPNEFKSLSASHILVMFPGAQQGKAPTAEEEAEALKKIEAIQKDLKDGKDFATLAKEKSDCPSKEKGGDLGTFAPGQMVPEFEAALLKLKQGEISGPVKTQFGYHIIKAGETQIASFEETKESIETFLKNNEGNKIARELIQKLMKDNNAKVLIEPPKAPAAPAPVVTPAPEK